MELADVYTYSIANRGYRVKKNMPPNYRQYKCHLTAKSCIHAVIYIGINSEIKGKKL